MLDSLVTACRSAAEPFPSAPPTRRRASSSSKIPNAISDFQPDAAVVQDMVNRGLTNLTGKATVADAWRSLVSTQDVVGIKVFSEPGEISGTRPAVVAAVIHGLLDAGVPAGPHHHLGQARRTICAPPDFSGSPRNSACAWPARRRPATTRRIFTTPDTAIIGNLVWGDLEFGKKGEGVGRKSFVSELVSRQITKIISVAPLLNDNDIGVCGHLYSLAMGSVDNTFRFEGDPDRLAVAVPEIYALPALGDRVVLNITDALIGQYEGGAARPAALLAVPDQLWFSRDPVALDTMALCGTGPRTPRRERAGIQAASGNLHQRRPAPARRERPRENPGGKIK